MIELLEEARLAWWDIRRDMLIPTYDWKSAVLKYPYFKRIETELAIPRHKGTVEISNHGALAQTHVNLVGKYLDSFSYNCQTLGIPQRARRIAIMRAHVSYALELD